MPMRVAVAVGWKLLLTGVAAAAGPQSHLRWGEEYAGAGMNQWDALLVVAFVSVLLAGALLGAFAVSGYVLRRQPVAAQLALDLALFAVALGLAVGAGVTARVVDA
jgi:hypothetical protein